MSDPRVPDLSLLYAHSSSGDGQHPRAYSSGPTKTWSGEDTDENVDLSCHSRVDLTCHEHFENDWCQGTFTFVRE